MPLDKAPGRGSLPQTRAELQEWVRVHLHLPAMLEAALLSAIEAVLVRHERLWRESKEDALRAVSTGFAEKMAHIQRELSARDATASHIALYFERLVADLTDKSHRDPKTKLINFDRFTEQLESFLALEQRGRWSAVGLVDITSFKWYNDTLGHAVGDRIIERVAHLLREQVRSDDVIAQDRPAPPPEDLHARFGGDEFCFLIPALTEYRQAFAVAERFREAVDRYDWTAEDRRLAERPVHVDVGVVCFQLGPIAERRASSRRLASALISQADKLMYEAKGERAGHIHIAGMRIEHGELVQFSESDDAQPSGLH
jgi:GGDEF domain-containing protein